MIADHEIVHAIGQAALSHIVHQLRDHSINAGNGITDFL